MTIEVFVFDPEHTLDMLESIAEEEVAGEGADDEDRGISHRRFRAVSLVAHSALEKPLPRRWNRGTIAVVAKEPP